MAQASLHTQSLGMAIAQTTYATEADSETRALRADAHCNKETNGVQILATLRTMNLNALRLEGMLMLLCWHQAAATTG